MAVGGDVDHNNGWELTGEAYAFDARGRPRFLLHVYQVYLGIEVPESGPRCFACDVDCLTANNGAGSTIIEQSWHESTLKFSADGAAHVATVILVDNGGLAVYLRCEGGCGSETVDHWPGIGLGYAYTDRYTQEVSPAITMAVTSSGDARMAYVALEGPGC